MKNFLTFLLLSILIAGCSSHSKGSIPATPISNIQLEVSDFLSSENKIFEVGSFVIHWRNTERVLEVFHKENTLKNIWASPSNIGFLAVAETDYTFEESRGSFTLKDKIFDKTHAHLLQNIELIGSQLKVSSKLKSNTNSVLVNLFFKPISERELGFEIKVGDENYNRVFLQYASNAEERFYGFGEQYSHFNHKGNFVPILVNEQGIGRGDITDPIINLVLGNSTGDDYTSYKVTPQYITSQLRSLFIENYEFSSFNLMENNRVELTVFSSEIMGRILYGKNPIELIETYTAFCGRMSELPDWIMEGAILGVQGGTQKVYKVWNDLKSQNTPVAAFWLQDWEGQRTTVIGKQLWWNWELDNDRYPGWDRMRDSMLKEDVRLMGYINPFIVQVFGEKENYRRNQFKEANDNNFLVTNRNNRPYMVQNTSFSSGILDISNPDCEEWLKDIIKDELLGRGMYGWMADFAEALPFDGNIQFPEGPKVYHNKYPEEWVRINREAIQEVGLDGEIIFFSRAAYRGSPKYCTLFWEGDQITDWGQNDGIKSAITGLMSGGMSGFSLNHSDIGGYLSINYPIPFITKITRTFELARRWAEMNAFSVVYRTHEGADPDNNFQVYQDEQSIAHFAKWAKVFKALAFYRKELVREASINGLPVVRHPFIHFHEDVNVYDIRNEQFMFGSELMVAPVLNPGVNSLNVYLPQGVWIDLWTLAEYNSTGQSYTISNLQDKPAVFYPKGSVVGSQFRQNMMDLGVSF